jgi:hypothetical protein
LPDNDKIRILAISVADENPETKPLQPLYDVLPSPNAGPSDFTLSASPVGSIAQGKTATSKIIMMPRGDFHSNVDLTVSGLPEGVTASFSPVSTSGASTLTLTASNSAAPTTTKFTISGVSGNLSRSVTTAVTITPILTGTVPVDLSSAYNVTGIYKDGSKFSPSTSLDDGGYALSEQALGSEPVGDEVVFHIGPPNAPDAVTSKTVDLPADKFASLRVLALGVEGDQEMQAFTINYADGTSSSFTRSLSDWAEARDFPGESVAVRMPYRLVSDGSTDDSPFNACAFSFSLDKDKKVRSISLPSNRNVVVLAITLVPAGI